MSFLPRKVILRTLFPSHSLPRYLSTTPLPRNVSVGPRRRHTPETISQMPEYLTKSWLISSGLRPPAGLVRAEVRPASPQRCLGGASLTRARRRHHRPPSFTTRHPHLIHLYTINRNNQSLIFWGGQSTSCCNYLINVGVPYGRSRWPSSVPPGLGRPGVCLGGVRTSF